MSIDASRGLAVRSLGTAEAPPAHRPVLEARQLAIGYPGHRVGDGIDLAVCPGDVLALLGPNGGGKTTLLKTLLGVIPPLGGEVLLNGVPLPEIPDRQRARTAAYVPQTPSTAFAFSALDLVLMGRTAHAGLFARPSSADRSLAIAALDRLGIGHLAQRSVTTISGGERQLVLIARALAQDPTIILLDEPTASLDFGNQGLILGEIGRLAESGLAVLFTTHDPNHALSHADRVLLIRDGRPLANGSPNEVLTRHRLEELYQAPIEEIDVQDRTRRVFRPRTRRSDR